MKDTWSKEKEEAGLPVIVKGAFAEAGVKTGRRDGWNSLSCFVFDVFKEETIMKLKS